jgi:hypothetical protein
LWIDAICGSVQNSMTPPEKNVVRRVGKPTLYEPGCHRPIFPHHWLKQSARQYLDADLQAQLRRTAAVAHLCFERTSALSATLAIFERNITASWFR